MERFLLVFGVGILLCATGLRAETLANTASVPLLVSPALLPVTFFGLLLALGGYLYAQARRS